jgi:hypothetical protein
VLHGWAVASRKSALEYRELAINHLLNVYDKNELCGENFWVNEYSHDKAIAHLSWHYRYDFMYLSPSKGRINSVLAAKAFMPWIQVFTLSFELEISPNEKLHIDFVKAVLEAQKSDQILRSHQSLKGSSNARKKRSDTTKRDAEIQRLSKAGTARKRIAEQLEVSQATVSRVLAPPKFCSSVALQRRS